MNLRSITKLGLVSLLIAACSGGGTTDNQQPTYDPTLPGNLEPADNTTLSDYSGLWLQTIRLEGDILAQISQNDLGDIELVQNEVFAFNPTGNTIDVRACNYGTDDIYQEAVNPIFEITESGLSSSIRNLISDSKLNVIGWNFVLKDNLKPVEQTILPSGIIRYQTDSDIEAEVTINIQIPGETSVQSLPFDYLGSASIEWVKISDEKAPLEGQLTINNIADTQISCFSSHYANVIMAAQNIEVAGQARQINQTSSSGNRLSLLSNSGFKAALGGFEKQAIWRLASEARPTSRKDAQINLSAPLPDFKNRQFTGSFSTTYNGDASGELMIQL
ncbi:hypothetical protein [Pelagibaculum spongiae]|uniref:Uncharacterized protein n=1 Tax=Pelagibaculum spongiae TaxID=2080658 RepID=A0A2V1H6S4_9GAMM|nr:hypothetical protein [Pelagibaculum spongiae]PVZ72132.1 hypothetical protein DC094_03705 [Pelagibaculum spongiae]